MIRLSKQSQLMPEALIERAFEYFGPKGEQLQETERGDCCISFEGGGGYVSVTVAEEGAHRVVDIETREFEYQAKRFLETL